MLFFTLFRCSMLLTESYHFVKQGIVVRLLNKERRRIFS